MSIFDIEIDIHGVRVVARSVSLCEGCWSDVGVDTNVKRLKDEAASSADVSYGLPDTAQKMGP